MDDQALDRAPIWDDVTTFDGRPWRGRVDLLFGGIPCQPYSCAGKGLGEKDERDLWSDARRILRETGAQGLFLENVAAFVNRGMPRVLRDLSEDGFDAVWGVFSCGGLGAPHRRERLFLLGYTQGFRFSGGSLDSSTHEGRQAERQGCQSYGVLADSGSGNLGLEPRRGSGSRGSDAPQLTDSGESLAAAAVSRTERGRGLPERRFGETEPGSYGQKWPTPRASVEKMGRPRKNDRDCLQAAALSGQEARTQENGETSLADCGQQYLNPLFVEWLMGFPTGWASPRKIELKDFEPWETQLARQLPQWLGGLFGSELGQVS